MLLRTSSIAVTFAVTLVSTLVLTTYGHQDVTIDQILKPWSARQKRVRSAKFAWIERETQAKGSSTQLPKLRKDDAQSPIPPEDFTQDRLVTLSFDGDKLRYAYRHKEWSRTKNDYVDQEYLSAFDGRVNRHLHPPGGVAWPIGIVRPENKYEDARNVHIAPVLMTYRSVNTKMGVIDLAKLRISPEVGTINNRRCLILEHPPTPAERTHNTYWVDPAREFTVVRVTLGQPNWVQVKLDISHTHDPEAGWVPTSWDLVWTNPDGSLSLSAKAKVTKRSINPQIEPAEFQLEFPRGTRVVDESGKERKDYIVRDGAEPRVILPADIGATYEQMLNSEPGEALNPPKSPVWYWWVALVLLGILVVTGIALIRRRGSRSA